MQFKFSLEKVLKYRKTLEDLAQISFQEAVAQNKKEETILMQMENEIVEARKTAYQLQSQAMDQALAQLQNIEQFIKLQGVRIGMQKAKIQNSQKLVEERREILRTCVTESKILLKLKEKRKVDFVKQMNKAEQLEMDEMSLMRVRMKDQK